MIISRTPFRVSFFGGGTDYPAWYREHGGAVLAVAINKYCYITCRYLPPFFEHKTRIVWSQIEMVKDHGDIQHHAVRAVLDYLGCEEGVEIHHDGDLPARSGLGSSSAFTVGILHALYALRKEMKSKRDLSFEAIHVEQNLLNENVGSQDQIITAHGGLNRIDFQPDGDYLIKPLILPEERADAFQEHLMLFFTGLSRTASDIAENQLRQMKYKAQEMHTMLQLVDEAEAILASKANLVELGYLFNETWKLKKSLNDAISNPQIDEIYKRALTAGAVGGKLLGAGGGGFILFFVEPEKQEQVRAALKELLFVRFNFEHSGTQIIFIDHMK